MYDRKSDLDNFLGMLRNSYINFSSDREEITKVSVGDTTFIFNGYGSLQGTEKS